MQFGDGISKKKTNANAINALILRVEFIARFQLKWHISIEIWQ